MHRCICKAGLVLGPDGSPAATLRRPVRQSVRPSAHPSVRAETKQLLISSWADKTNRLRSKGRAGTLMCGTAALRVTLHFKELHSSLRRRGPFRPFSKNGGFFPRLANTHAPSSMWKPGVCLIYDVMIRIFEQKYILTVIFPTIITGKEWFGN